MASSGIFRYYKWKILSRSESKGYRRGYTKGLQAGIKICYRNCLFDCKKSEILAKESEDINK